AADFAVGVVPGQTARLLRGRHADRRAVRTAIARLGEALRPCHLVVRAGGRDRRDCGGGAALRQCARANGSGDRRRAGTVPVGPLDVRDPGHRRQPARRRRRCGAGGALAGRRTRAAAAAPRCAAARRLAAVRRPAACRTGACADRSCDHFCAAGRCGPVRLQPSQPVNRFFSAGGERAISAVPAWILWLLAAALAAQIGWQSAWHSGVPAASDLPPAPTTTALRLASFGETAALARLAMLWLQAFDSRGDNSIPYQKLDYERLTAWLGAILATDPRSGYPLFAASRVYAENADARKARRMFDFIEAEFVRDPNGRWAALAQAALLAKHRLRDLPLARRYAAEIQ